MKGIYQIKNKVNGKRYIGMTNNINRRLYEHFADSKLRDKTTVLSRAIRKYGKDSFEFSVIEKAEKDSDLPKKEQYWIKELMPEYNMNEGGLGNCGFSLSDEAKNRIREKAVIQWEKKTEKEKEIFIARNLKGPRVGHQVPVSTREKLRIANLGKKQTAETTKKRSIKMKVSMVGNKNGNKSVFALKNGEVVMRFRSIIEAAKHIGRNPSSITAALKGRQKLSGGYEWSYGSVETNRDECNGVGVSLPHVQARGTRKGEEIVQSGEIVNRRGADKGLLQLAMRTGQYKFINADKVYDGELLSRNKLTGEIVLNGAKTSDTVIGYFAYMETLNGFQKVLYWPIDEIEAHAKKFSESYKSKKDFVVQKSPWTTNFDAMAKKTVLKALLGKYGIMSVEMAQAFDRDAEDTPEEVVKREVEGAANQDFIDIQPPPKGSGLPGSEVDADFTPAVMTDAEKAEIAAMEAAQADQGPGY